jgi:creatinine amidohydrolase
MKQAGAGMAVLLYALTASVGWQAPPAKGVALSDLRWPDAETWLTPSAVVVVPLGAGALEQGPHMTLDSDERLARYLASRVKAVSDVVVAPALNYHFYPAYGEYPGTATLGETVARDVTVDAVRSLARFGPRRFYVLNTSTATLTSLSAAARSLADTGILLGYTDPDYWIRSAPVLKQPRMLVSHADEASTSLMLFVDPTAVDMTRAPREYAQGRGWLTRQEGRDGILSKSGTLGDATLATAAKGAALADALVKGILGDIEGLRKADLPAARPSAAPPPPLPPPRPSGPPEPRLRTRCTPGEERDIRRVAEFFTYYWSQQQADRLSELFTLRGDIRHPDGSIERGREAIMANRARLFGRSEYHNSRHFVQLTDVRCLDDSIALADGKWELRLETPPPPAAPGRGMNPSQVNDGWCSLLLVKIGDAWLIEAWRYTINPPVGAPAPVLLSKPGFTTGRGGQ